MATVQRINVPDKGPPIVDWTTVSYTGDGTAFNRSFRYVHRRHTLKDILRPGYFDPHGEPVVLQSWDEISFCVGGPSPLDAVRGLLVVGPKPEKQGDHVTVGLVFRDAIGGGRGRALAEEKAA